MSTGDKILCGLLSIIVVLLTFIAFKGIQVTTTAEHHYTIRELDPFAQQMERNKEKVRAMWGSGNE